MCISDSNIATASGTVQGVNHRHCVILHRSDGYNYSIIKRQEETVLLPMAKARGFCYHQSQPALAGLTTPPARADAPTLKILTAALKSRSWFAPQSPHVHDLSLRERSFFMLPQAEQVLLDG